MINYILDCYVIHNGNYDYDDTDHYDDDEGHGDDLRVIGVTASSNDMIIKFIRVMIIMIMLI